MTTITDLRSAGAGDTPQGRRRRPNRIIAFGISAEDWDRLTELAVADLRDPEQQARWLVLRAIRAAEQEAAS